MWLTHRPYRANNAKQKYPCRQHYRNVPITLAIMESCSLIEIVALLRKHSELELQMLNGHSAAVATERELEATLRRLAAHPQALKAVLQTARALRRTPDAVSVKEVVEFGGSI